MKFIYAMVSLFAGMCLADAQPTRLSITLVPPSLVQLSWPSNATTWQLMNNTNLASANGWQPVLIPPSYVSNSFVVNFPITNISQFSVCRKGAATGAAVVALSKRRHRRFRREAAAR